MEIRSIIKMLLAINCLLLSIEQYRLSKRLIDLTNNLFKDEKEVIQNDKRRNQE